MCWDGLITYLIPPSDCLKVNTVWLSCIIPVGSMFLEAWSYGLTDTMHLGPQEVAQWSIRQLLPPTDAIGSIQEYSCKQVHGNFQLTILMQVATMLLGACFLYAIGSITSAQIANQAASEVLPALQGGTFLHLKWQVPKLDLGTSHLPKSEWGWCSIAGYSGLARLKCLWVGCAQRKRWRHPQRNIETLALGDS